MTKDYFLKIMRQFETIYGVNLTVEQRSVWGIYFNKWEEQDFKRIAEEIMKTIPRMPTIADFYKIKSEESEKMAGKL